MGPRPFGRGRCVLGAAGVAANLLQWGRDLSVAEGRSPLGGRPRRRRFNGAATFRSRKALGRAAAAAGGGGFNGAATFRSRKAVGGVRGGRLAHSASMGPRPFGRGRDWLMGPKDLEGLLQWGRDLSVAEGGPPARTSMPRSVLQWGRDLSVAEGAARRPIAEATLQLQWGRDLSVAEGRSI